MQITVENDVSAGDSNILFRADDPTAKTIMSATPNVQIKINETWLDFYEMNPVQAQPNIFRVRLKAILPVYIPAGVVYNVTPVGECPPHTICKLVSTEVSPLLQDLVAVFSMEEVSGDPRVDTVNSIVLTDTNTVLQAEGINGFAAAFDGTNFLETIDNLLDLGGTSFEISFWFYQDTTDDKTIMQKYDNNDSGNRAFLLAYFFDLMAQGKVVYVKYIDQNNSTVVEISAPITLTAATWHHISISYDNVARIGGIFVNGVLYTGNGTAEPINHSTAPFNIGAAGSLAPALEGRIDELYIWKGRVLTETERNDLANGAVYPFN